MMWQFLKTLTMKKNKKEIIINVESLETRIAILEEGKLEDFAIERPSEDRIVGSVFKGKIQNLEDGLQAAFVDIGMKKNAFIHYWDMIPDDTDRLEAGEGYRERRPGRKKRFAPGEMVRRFPVGSEIVVQVTKGAIGTKGPRVTASLSIPGRYLVMLPGTTLKGVSRKIEDPKERLRLKKVLARLPAPAGNGLIVRTAGAGARKVSFVRDVRAIHEIWEQIERGMRETPAPCRLYQEPDLVERMIRDYLTEDIDRIVVDDRDEYEQIKNIVSRISRRTKGKVKLYDGHAPVFEHFDVERQLESAFRRKVWLKSGGYIVIDETEALVAIDINTGRHKGGKTQEESILQVNLEAADEVARQLRMRNIGGLIVVDFIDMRQRKHQTAVYRALRDALKRDKARNNVLPISDLGLLEMTRQRMEESVRAATFTDCAYCKGRGKVKSALTMSVEIQRHIGEAMRRQRAAGRSDVPLKIIVHPVILDRLRTEDEALLLELEEKHKGRLTFVSNPALHLEEFAILHAETGEELYTNVERKESGSPGPARPNSQPPPQSPGGGNGPPAGGPDR
jgi:ribonuclease G